MFERPCVLVLTVPSGHKRSASQPEDLFEEQLYALHVCNGLRYQVVNATPKLSL